MYLGVRSHGDAKRVTCYDDARKALDRASRTSTGKARQEKQFGFHLGMNRNHGVTWVREDENGSIAFRLYETDVVVWSKDNSVHVDNFGTTTTSGFAERFLPSGIHLHYPSARRGMTGGANTIGYSFEGERWVCQGDVVELREVGGEWIPNLDTLYELNFPVRSAKAADSRKLAQIYHLAEFEAWLEHAPRLLKAGGNPVEHLGWDMSECLEALKRRDWRSAAEYLPLIADTGAYGRELKPLPIEVGARDAVVTMGSLTKLRLAMLEDEGHITTISAKALPCKTYDKHMALVRQLTALGLDQRGWGPE